MAYRKNYRRLLNRAYLVLTLIWILGGLIYPLYQADNWRILQEQKFHSCLHAVGADDQAAKGCTDLKSAAMLDWNFLHPFESTYGDYRKWPLTVSLVCLVPPLLCYGFTRVVMTALGGSRMSQRELSSIGGDAHH